MTVFVAVSMTDTVLDVEVRDVGVLREALSVAEKTGDDKGRNYEQRGDAKVQVHGFLPEASPSYNHRKGALT